MAKEIPEGFWLMLAQVEDGDRLAELERDYGRMGGGNSDVPVHDLFDVDIGMFQLAVGAAMHTFSSDLRIEWDPKLIEQLYKEDEFGNSRNPKQKAHEKFLDYLNTGLKYEEVIIQAEWEGTVLVLKPLTRTLLGKAWLQLYDAMVTPVPWKLCGYCKNPFPIRRKGSVYCSDSCRAGAYKKRKGILK
ncbi:MAG: hypothetical protein AB2669_07805 [Candidatus Thiodiazotropha endolucinida]